jgi:hypothetical protein
VAKVTDPAGKHAEVLPVRAADRSTRRSRARCIATRLGRVRITSEGDVRRVDLAMLRRLIPPLWSEWANLEFTSEGWLRDPDTGQPLGILRLVHGRHRVPGARYTVGKDKDKDKEELSFVLTLDRGRTVQGTLSGQWWSVDLEIGDQLSAVGRADVDAALRASDVPGILIPLIGAREATGRVRVDPSSLERGGELVRGAGEAQRCAGEFVARVKTARNEWHGHLTVRVKGRGLLGRAALAAFRSKVASAIREALDEFLDDTAKEAVGLASGLGDLEDQVRAAGGEQAFVHRYLWQSVHELALPFAAPAAAASAAGRPTAAAAATVGVPTRLRRGPLGVRRLERPVELSFPAQSDKYLINHGSITNTGELIVRTRGDRLRAHWPSQGRYDTPPAFHGVVERQAATLTITGKIRETRAARSFPLVFGFTTGLMVLIAIFGIYSIASGTAGGYPPLLIGLIGTPSSALIWWFGRKDRRPEFVRDSDRLEDGLRRWFTSGDAHRSFL